MERAEKGMESGLHNVRRTKELGRLRAWWWQRLHLYLMMPGQHEEVYGLAVTAGQLLGHAVVDLGAVHAKGAVVIEQ